METPIVEKVRELRGGFEHYTFETSKSYAGQCDDSEDLVEAIDDNLTIAERDWDTRQVWDYDDNGNLIIGTLTGYDPKEDEPIADAFLRIVLPDSWK